MDQTKVKTNYKRAVRVHGQTLRRKSQSRNNPFAKQSSPLSFKSLHTPNLERRPEREIEPTPLFVPQDSKSLDFTVKLPSDWVKQDTICKLYQLHK
jgi:hypothetical protein